MRAVLLTLLLLVGQGTAQADLSFTLSNINAAIPDNNASGLISLTNIVVADPTQVITDINVRLHIAGASQVNGDLFVVLQHAGHSGILLNRVGRRPSDLIGYSDPGFDVTFNDDGPATEIHQYRLALFGNEETFLTGALEG